MENLAVVKRDFELLERRRLRAASLLSKGLSEAEVARRIGVHRQSVNRWNRQLAESGPAALKAAGRAGRKSQLEPSDLRRVEAGLKSGPRALGDENAMWTTRRAVELIEVLCGVKYTTVHAWRILRQLGWSWQRPSWRPPEQGKATLIRLKKGRVRELKKTTGYRAKP
jgi:transposase